MLPIFFLTGAPAVGKSTSAHALAERFEKSIHIPVDDIRDMVVSGLVYPGEWTPSLIEQLQLARESVTHMARAYNQAGFVVVIDDFWDPISRLSEYDALFQQPNVHRVLLYPSQHAAHARNLKRSGGGDGGQYIAGGIKIVYEQLVEDAAELARQGWIVVDTTDKDLKETVTYILTQVGD